TLFSSTTLFRSLMHQGPDRRNPRYGFCRTACINEHKICHIADFRPLMLSVIIEGHRAGGGEFKQPGQPELARCPLKLSREISLLQHTARAEGIPMVHTTLVAGHA